MPKLKLKLDDLRVETFETAGRRLTLDGTVHALSASRGGIATCVEVTCGEVTCVDEGCSGTFDENSCEFNPCGESVSCTSDVCNQSDRANECTVWHCGSGVC